MRLIHVDDNINPRAFRNTGGGFYIGRAVQRDAERVADEFTEAVLKHFGIEVDGMDAAEFAGIEVAGQALGNAVYNLVYRKLNQK
jgi:hypothetical protein